jgi:MFS family permease
MRVSLRPVDPKLLVLITTAGVDMLGTLMVLPLLPFYATRMGANAFVYTCIVSSFSVATLCSAPIWGRFSDRYGRRPALLIALSASAVAYVIFAFATSLPMLFLSRIVQGAGGGTVGVIQAYVADSTPPKDRARALGWLSAATNVGVSIGPLLGSWAMILGRHHFTVGAHDLALGRTAPGLIAAVICLANMYFAWRYLRESHTGAVRTGRVARVGRARQVLWSVIRHSDEPASRLIWIYAVGLGAFMGMTSIFALFLGRRFGVTEATIGYFFAYVGVINIISRALLLGPAVDRLGEPRLARVGTVLLALGLFFIPLAPTWPLLALPVALLPLGTAFTFPGVTSMLSRVISPDERVLYMGVQQTFGGVTRVLFPLGAGFLYDHFTPTAPFWAGAIIVIATLLLGLDMETYVRPETPAPVPAPAATATGTPTLTPTAAAVATPSGNSPVLDVPVPTPPGAAITPPTSGRPSTTRA